MKHLFRIFTVLVAIISVMDSLAALCGVLYKLLLRPVYLEDDEDRPWDWCI